MDTRLRPGVRVLDRLMKANAGFSVARMTPAQLEEAQTAVIPDSGPAALFLGRMAKGVDVRMSSFPARHGELPLRIYTPEAWCRSPRPVVVNFHGGGFVLGSARQGDWSASIVAAELDAVVISVDYRLAPAHRFPAAIEDCYDALLWTAEHAADLGGDPARIGIMGDSAGGNLAAVVAIMARDEGGPAISHQTLVYPVTDMSEAIQEDASVMLNTRGIVLSNDDMEIFREHYLDVDVDPEDFRLSPLRAQFQLPDNRVDYAAAKLEVDRIIDPSTDTAAVRRQLDQWERAVRGNV
ncbi:MAG: alpha/beta hydrolase, partial [Actinomycetales bacterium]